MTTIDQFIRRELDGKTTVTVLEVIALTERWLAEKNRPLDVSKIKALAEQHRDELVAVGEPECEISIEEINRLMFGVAPEPRRKETG